MSHDFYIFNLMEKPLLPRPVLEKAWRKPLHGEVKINFDATIVVHKMSYGLVARDHDGFVLGGRVGIVAKEVQID